jgi:hypothetical protein
MKHIGTAAVLAAAIALTPLRAHAGSGDAASAQVLFEEGLGLMDKGRYAEACPKLEASQKLDPGSGTQYQLAQCYEKTGRLASAWALYVEVAQAARSAGKQDRAGEVQRRADAIAPALPKVKIELTPETKALPGLEVSRDGVGIGAALVGSDLPVDPGSHTVRISAPGHVSFNASFEVSGTQSVSVSVPALEVGEDGRSPLKTTGIVVGAAGVAGVGVGAVFAILAAGKWSDARKACPENMPGVCTLAGAQLGHDANTFANVANAGFIGGGVLAATGIVLFLVAPRASSAPPAATGFRSLEPTFDGSQLGLKGRF